MVSPAAGVGSVRALKVLVVVMGVLIVVGTVALVWVVVQRMGNVAAATARFEVGLDLPEGTRIAGVAATEGAIAVWVTGPQGDRVLLVDPRRGRVAGEIRPGR